MELSTKSERNSCNETGFEKKDYEKKNDKKIALGNASIEQDKKLFIQNYGNRDLSIVRGKGAFVWDSEGREYLDFIQGIAVNALGHCAPPVVEAIQSQAAKLIHVSNLFLQDSQQNLAALLLRYSRCDKVFFCNSGTEANEAAFKFSRKYWVKQGQDCRYKIVSLTESFHGRTYAALAATGQEKLKQGFGPMPEGFIHSPAGDAQALLSLLNSETLEKGGIAAIIFEPVQMEGGIITQSSEMVTVLKEAQSKGCLLIADEIQSGLGRAGVFLACEKLGIDPDIVTLAKPLGGGLPLGAVLVSNLISNSIGKGDHGSTFGGNPVACAAGHALLECITAEGFLPSLRERANDFRIKLAELLQKHNQLTPKGVLGLGFLLGFPYSGNLDLLLLACRREGLLVLRAGTNVLRMLPPLNLSEEEAELALFRLDAALASQ